MASSKIELFDFDDLSEQVSINYVSDSKSSQIHENTSESVFEPTKFLKTSRTISTSYCEHTVLKNQDFD